MCITREIDVADIPRLINEVYDAAKEAKEKICLLNIWEFLFNAKFNQIGTNPLDATAYNLIEQINQNLTLLITYWAIRHLLKPGLEVKANLADKKGVDIEFFSSKYLRSLSRLMSFSGGVLVYSLWEGYKRQERMQTFLNECAALGLNTVSLHTSGHADAKAITELIARTRPREIYPIHTENAAWFRRFADDSTRVVLA